jgi:biotin carboxyl carrier protein
MTLYYVSIGTNEYRVEISNFLTKINGESIQAALVELGEHGMYVLKKGPWKREMLVQRQENSQYSMNSDGKYFVVKVEKSNSKFRRKTSNAAVGDIKAPISGVVVKVNVKEGDQVAEGDVVVVLESMKMQMLLKASVSGIVKSVLVNLGLQLAKGDLIVKIE